MSNSSDSAMDDETRARTKEVSRDSRLSFRNFAEHQMRQEFKDLAKEKCKDQIQAFAECAQDEGLLVVIKCRKFHREFNNCMAIHNSNEAWEQYKEQHKQELEKRTLKT